MTRRTWIGFLLLLYALLVIYIDLSLAAGAQPSAFLTPISTGIGFTVALLHAGEYLGWKRGLWLLGCVFVVSLAFESVGVATGLVYGPYHYDPRKLGPLLFGLVPPLIPVAWFMMMYPAYLIADQVIPAGWMRARRLLTVAACGGLVMTAWDLVMDPLMVRGGHWVWEVEGAYFGIPLQNFWGWWLTVFTTFVLFQLWAGRGQSNAGAGDASFKRQAIGLYAITGIGNVVGALLFGLGGPALAGLFAMLPWVILGWLKANVSS